MDRAKMEEGIRTFVEGLGIGSDDRELADTPARVARAWADDLVAGYATEPDSVVSWSPVEDGGGPVLVRGVSMASVCVHHLLPFYGTAHVAYLPRRRQAGLSKLGRVVEAHARRLQTQERLTQAIVDTLERSLEPHAAMVVIEAHHTCMAIRGVRKEHSRMVTVAASGLWRDVSARCEILGLLQATGRP